MKIFGKFIFVMVLISPLTMFSFTASAGTYNEALTAYGSKDYKRAIMLFESLAEQGGAKAQYQLGFIYTQGLGVEQNYTTAMKWYRKAAEQGYADAQYDLGIMYSEGYGVEQNYTEAIKWYSKAAEQGYARAQYNLGVMYYYGQGVVQNYTMAYVWFSIATAQGNEGSKKGRDMVAKELDSAALIRAQNLAEDYYRKYVVPFKGAFGGK